MTTTLLTTEVLGLGFASGRQGSKIKPTSNTPSVFERVLPHRVCVPIGRGELELCANRGDLFPVENWCRGGAAIRVIGGSYEHCDVNDCLADNTCPQSTVDCSVELTDSTLRNLIDTCDGNTACSVTADSRSYFDLVV